MNFSIKYFKDGENESNGFVRNTMLEGLEICLLYSLKYDVEMIDNHTGELHFSKKGDKFYISTLATLVLVKNIQNPPLTY